MRRLPIYLLLDTSGSMSGEPIEQVKYGLGMLVSALTAPIYARSLIKVAFRRKLSFTVTAKGPASSLDSLWTFRYSLLWAGVPSVILAVALLRHRPYPMMFAWTAVILVVCLAPVGIWLLDTALDTALGPRRTKAGHDSGTNPGNAAS